MYHLARTSILSGPQSCTMHRDIYCKKTIYVFGEEHGYTDVSSDPHAQTITQYLEHLFCATNVYIDFFLEAPVTNVDKAHLNTLFSIYNKHRNPDNRDIMCSLIESQLNVMNYLPMVRNHYIDPRINNNTRITVFGPIIKLILHKNLKSLELCVLKTLYTQICILYTSMGYNTQEDYVEYIINFITNEANYVSKQLNRSFMKSQICDFTENIVRKLYNKYYSVINLNLDMNSQDHSLFEKGVYDIFTLVFIMDALMLDIVCLSRMFKRFTNYPCTQSELLEPNNMIVYVGEAHARNIRLFLIKNGFKIIEYAQSSIYKRSIDMKSISQPFFVKQSYVIMTPNDIRNTCITWQFAGGVEAGYIAQLYTEEYGAVYNNGYNLQLSDATYVEDTSLHVTELDVMYLINLNIPNDITALNKLFDIQYCKAISVYNSSIDMKFVDPNTLIHSMENTRDIDGLKTIIRVVYNAGILDVC